MRKAMGISNWERAQKTVREWETDDSINREIFDVERAGLRFIEDAESRHITPETVNKYKLLLREMRAFFGGKDLRYLTLDDLSSYRSSWKMAPITAQKKLERMKTFFKFCKERGWVKENRAVLLKSPRVEQSVTLPFTDEQWEKILWATEVYEGKKIKGCEAKERVRMFVYLLRYTGLRIQDVIRLRWLVEIKDSDDGWHVLLRTEKTGQPVCVPISKELAKEIEVMWTKLGEPNYLFWTGEGKIKSAISVWQKILVRLFKIAGVKGHAHMFRTTFAVELLKKNVPLETVATLLGNSVRICEKHYSPWVHSRQLALDTAVRSTWKMG